MAVRCSWVFDFFFFALYCTRKRRPASRVFFFLPAFGRCCPSVSAHPANRTRCSSNIAIADHFPSKSFSFKHHLTGEACILPFHSNTSVLPLGQCHPANCICCSSNIAIADHFPSKTFSFKHHLTGEAWPACRANLPFHSNTT